MLKRTSGGLVHTPAHQVFRAIHLFVDDRALATDSLLTDGGLLLEVVEDYVLSRGMRGTVKLTCDLREDAGLGSYVVEFADSSFAEFMDSNLLTAVYPELVGGDYPFLTPQVSVAPNNLVTSFTNYPNPFNPSRDEATTIGYVLPEDGYVDLEIFTITGESVKRVARGDYREAGPHQEDTWSGINDSGYDVLPGTYFCRITARYGSGRTESCRRKVTVVR
jgi:hypothetical protein